MRVFAQEELDAFEKRGQPSEDARSDNAVKAVTCAVEKTMTKCFQEKSVELLTDEEISKSVLAALPTKMIRQHHGPVLNESTKMLMKDTR